MALVQSNFKFSNLLKGDFVVWMIYFLLCMISLVEVFSASSRLTFSGGSHLDPFFNQAFFLGVGFALLFIIHRIPCKLFIFLSPLWIPCFILLAFTSFRSSGGVNATHRWLQVAGFSFQPSELVKATLIMWVAMVLAKSQSVIKTAKGKILVGAVKGEKISRAFKWVGVPTVLSCGIIFMDNVSTAIMLFLVIFAMMIIGRVPWSLMFKGLGGILLCAAFAVTIAYAIPEEALLKMGPVKRLVTVKHRIERFGGDDDEVVFGSPEWEKKVLSDQNSQSTYANIAIANSGGIGVGPGNSVQRDFLQHAESDFIFAIIVEETGLWGALSVMGLYIWLFFRTGQIAMKCRKFFPAFLVIGFGLMMMMQALVNMAVAVGAIPVTGQTLPFISRGGTSILVTSFYIGVILSVSRYAYSPPVEENKVEEVLEGETNEFATEGNMA